MHPNILNLNAAIEETLNNAMAELAKNAVSEASAVYKVTQTLKSIWENIKQQGYSEHIGLDSELRPSYVIMQGIIERALAGLSNQVEGYIITPRMPTPLMLKVSQDLNQLNLEDPMAFARYRNGILKGYLANCKLYAVYSNTALSTLSDNEGVEIYKTYCNQYPHTLKDKPIINIDMAKFPTEFTGALYYVSETAPLALDPQAEKAKALADFNRTNLMNFLGSMGPKIGLGLTATSTTALSGSDQQNVFPYASARPVVKKEENKILPIAIESKQVTQINNSVGQKWRISFGPQALARVNQMNEFFNKFGAADLVRSI